MLPSCRVLWIFLFSLSVTFAQKPKTWSTADIHDAVRKLNVLGSVLYVAAHPDDENTRLIAYMANHVKARTAYLSLTRGDGGQNLIGPELRELLGVIRTQELLAARRIDGGEQRFTRANDFGYSKHPDETLSIWNKEEVLGDVIWAIRTFKPDVVINRFDHRTPGRTHGHHTSSAMLSMEAFDLSADENQYKNQLNYTDAWQPKRLFFNTSWWFYGSQENFEKADKSNMLNFDIGVYYPSKGMSNNEIASLASSQHLCQGFGRVSTRGSQMEYIEFLKGMPLSKQSPEDNPDVFEGIDISWNRVNGGKAIAEILEPIEKDFNYSNPASHLPDLLKALRLVEKLEDAHWKEIKTKEIRDIIQACAGLYLEASASEPTASPGQSVALNIEALNRSRADIKIRSIKLSTGVDSIEKNLVLENNQRQNLEETLVIPENWKITSPYWLNSVGTLGMYRVDEQNLIGEPETPRTVSVHFRLEVEGQPLELTRDVIYRYSRPDEGELYRPFEILPEATAKLNEKVYIFDSEQPQDVEVIVKAGRNQLEGTVSLDYPDGWSVYPAMQRVSIAQKGDSETLVFTVIPPKNRSEGFFTPVVEVNGKEYTRELVEIDYDHIPFQSVILPSKSKVVRVDIIRKGQNIGYIEGAGDAIPESLNSIGYNVVNIKPNDINAELLSNFDALVVGIRAYNVVNELKFKQDILFDFVRQGGNMIVQYNTSRGIKVDEIGPYPLKLSRDRVTDETAEVSFLNPDHPVLNFPNKIEKRDFDGWVQERGLYFPGEWSDEYIPVLSMNDPGETPKDGSLLVAKYGKGYYVYTGLSFFREFPAGVAGAYRLFANMLSLGKDNINLDKKLTD